jgi:hypothetical protein
MRNREEDNTAYFTIIPSSGILGKTRLYKTNITLSFCLIAPLKIALKRP